MVFSLDICRVFVNGGRGRCLFVHRASVLNGIKKAAISCLNALHTVITLQRRKNEDPAIQSAGYVRSIQDPSSSAHASAHRAPL